MIYSETAAQNYSDPEMFKKICDVLPARRCGTTAEVRFDLFLGLKLLGRGSSSPCLVFFTSRACSLHQLTVEYYEYFPHSE